MHPETLDVLPGGVREAARRLGKSERVMYRLAKAGQLPFCVRVGAQYVVPREAFARYMRTAAGAMPDDHAAASISTDAGE